MNNNIKGTRKIKCVGNSVDTNEFFLHPNKIVEIIVVNTKIFFIKSLLFWFG